MGAFFVSPRRNLPTVTTADHLTRPTTQVIENGLEGFCGDLATLVDYDHLGQAVETMPQGRWVPLLYRLSGVDAEIVIFLSFRGFLDLG
jgi:hypothetical protein